MSDSPSGVLIGLPNTNLNGGELLGNGTSTTSDEPTESFSNLLNQAQSNQSGVQADSETSVKVPGESLLIDAGPEASSDEGRELAATLANSRTLSEREGALRRSTAASVEDIPSVPSQKSVELENTVSVEKIGSVDLVDESGSAIANTVSVPENYESLLASPETPDAATVPALPPSQPQVAALESAQSLGVPLSSVNTGSAGPGRDGSVLNSSAIGNDEGSTNLFQSLKIGPLSVSQSSSGSSESALVSAATVANRLNTGPNTSVEPKILQTVTDDSKNPIELNTKQVTTVAATQSIQAGLSGMRQAPHEVSPLLRGITQQHKGVTPPSIVTAPSQASAISSLAVSDPQPPMLLTGNGDTSATLLANPAVKLASSLQTTMVLNEASMTATTNSPIDNMLSATSSGIVTAPIIAKVDVTGAPLAQTPLNVPLQTSAAPDALAGNVRWMIGEGVQNAVVNVSPSGMGPISVQIGLEKEQMSISIIASQSSTREALESMLPRLRDQLGTQGAETIRVDISDGRGDRPGNHSGNERQNMSYASADSNTGAQHSDSDAKNSEQPNGQNAESRGDSPGERTLSASEQALVDEMKNSSSYVPLNNLSVNHGYDLYV
ncbi:MAG: flagellar hook-length control protein FliK [Granulosicoccus sp.]